MIVFNVRTDGMVESLPSIVPQASALADIVVISAYDYAYCHIRLTPSSGIYIPDVMCTPVLSTDRNVTMWTAPMPPEVTKMGGIVGYQIFFSAADGTTQKTNLGTFPVPRCEISTTPEMFEDASNKTIQDIYNIFADVYGAFVGLDREAQVYHPKVIKNEESINANAAAITDNSEEIADHEESITRLFEITAINGSAIEDFISHTYPTERDEIKDRLTTGGTILVPKGDWGDSEQNVTVQIKLKGNVLKPGTLMVLAPGNDATKQIVAEYGMSMRVNETVDGSADGEDIVVLERKPGKIPEANLTFCYAVIVIGGNTTPIATLVGGLGGSGSGGEEFYVGEDEPPATATVWIDPSGDPTNTETWEFVMENGDTVTKELVVVDD